MNILRPGSRFRVPDSCKGAAVALGNFDGVHLGHQAILRHTIAMAEATGGKAAVMTFEPHPREFFSRIPPPVRGRLGGGQSCSDTNAVPCMPPPQPSPYGGGSKLRLYSFRDKAELLRTSGIEILFVMRFNRALASLSAQAFVEDLLHKALAVRHVVTGTNFAFGKGRQGDTAFLDKTAAALGIGYTACPPVYDEEGQLISSSAVRAALAQGNTAKAAALLGRPYAITGRVKCGQQRGKSLGFPTANLSLDRLFKPRLGIYAARITVGENTYNGVASIGVNPTFGAYEPLLEAHIFDKEMELYGRRLRVEPAGFIRDERRFDDVEALKAQMQEDCRIAKEILHDKR